MMGTPSGKRLKALRETAHKTQLEVELDASLGSGYLQRLESGKVKHPERNTLERILAALDARYTQRRDLLELFGYLVDAPLPDESEINWAVALCQAELDSAAFPAYLLDCTHRLLVWNSIFGQLFKIDTVIRFGRTSHRPSMLRILFDPQYGVTPLISNPDVFFPAAIRALLSEMELFHGEAWYEALLSDLRRDCPTFEKYWNRSAGQKHYAVAARPLTPLEISLPECNLLQFRLLAEPFIQDRRFRIIYYLPADSPTIQKCNDWSQMASVLNLETGKDQGPT